MKHQTTDHLSVSLRRALNRLRESGMRKDEFDEAVTHSVRKRLYSKRLIVDFSYGGLTYVSMTPAAKKLLEKQ